MPVVEHVKEHVRCVGAICGMAHPSPHQHADVDRRPATPGALSDPVLIFVA